MRYHQVDQATKEIAIINGLIAQIREVPRVQSRGGGDPIPEHPAVRPLRPRTEERPPLQGSLSTDDLKGRFPRFRRSDKSIPE